MAAAIPIGAGSIPAHAGKPVTGVAGSRHPWVYPRPRGEASGESVIHSWRIGLSPPTRGSHNRDPDAEPFQGSIPAHAGKPNAVPIWKLAGWVYPRPRGEAALMLWGFVSVAGLSPPTRGSPRVDRVEEPARGSIPAHAGKPPCRSRRADCGRVYPRPRGEARQGPRNGDGERGLSPPTRGSLVIVIAIPISIGSIPAHAGKP